jgi:hypothetical protein
VKDKLKSFVALLLLSGLLGAVGAGAVRAGGILDSPLGKVVKVGGIGFLVKQFGPEINKTINTALQQRGVRYSGKTKVVPTFSVGNGVFVGGAQIQGEPSHVDKAKYVATVEIPLGRFRGKAYFPVESLVKSGKALKHVKGAGVTALIDFRI